jgi:hypothetical protein
LRWWTDLAARLGGAAVLALAVGWPRAAAGQSLFERLNLDRLRLSALGASVGPVLPTRVRATRAYGLHADYGEITPPWRVVFGVTGGGPPREADPRRDGRPVG